MLRTRLKQTGSVLSVVISLLILVLAGWMVLNRQFVFDKWSVANYQPTSAIASLVDRVGFSDEGKFYFYASQPSISSSSEFNLNCKKQEAQSAVLGCYSNGRIFVYDVPNTQLDGIEEVTAAHETLHAAWERMNESDKKAAGVLLDEEYAKHADKSLQERMAYYDRNEPGERLNELHSIIGTEVSSISPQLEQYYSKYFTDRTKVVALHASYQKVFDTIGAQSDALLGELNLLAADIKSDIASYNEQARQVSAESDALRARANTIDRTSQSAVNSYNATRQQLLARISQLEALRATISEKSATYTTKYAEYQKLVVRSNELTQSLDSTLAPAPSL